MFLGTFFNRAHVCMYALGLQEDWEHGNMGWLCCFLTQTGSLPSNRGVSEEVSLCFAQERTPSTASARYCDAQNARWIYHTLYAYLFPPSLGLIYRRYAKRRVCCSNISVTRFILPTQDGLQRAYSL